MSDQAIGTEKKSQKHGTESLTTTIISFVDLFILSHFPCHCHKIWTCFYVGST